MAATWGTDLRTWRTQMQLRQVDVALIVGVASNTVARWERGERTPHEMTRERVEQKLADYAARVAL